MPKEAFEDANGLDDDLVAAIQADVAYINRHKPSTPMLRVLRGQVRTFREVTEGPDELKASELMDGIIEDAAYIEAHRPSTPVLHLLAEQIRDAREIAEWTDSLKAEEYDLAG